MVRSRATAVTLPGTFSPVRRVTSFSRRASRAAMIASSYLLAPTGTNSEASFMNPSPLGWGRLRHGLEPAHAGALGVHDRHQAGDRLLEVVVHHQVVVFAILAQLARGVAEPPLDHLGRVGAAPEQALPERLDRGRVDEHRDRIAARAPNARAALDVHVEHHHPPRPKF